MTQHVKTHLFSLLPGERFRLTEFPGASIYTVVEGDGDKTAFLDETGHPVEGRAIGLLNGGSLFVYAMSREKGATGS